MHKLQAAKRITTYGLFGAYAYICRQILNSTVSNIDALVTYCLRTYIWAYLQSLVLLSYFRIFTYLNIQKFPDYELVRIIIYSMHASSYVDSKPAMNEQHTFM